MTSAGRCWWVVCRKVVQVDQAAPAHQGLLRDQRECGEDSDLDRRVGLCAGGDRTQAVGPGGQSLPNPTDSKRHALRENPILCALQAIDAGADLTENVNQLILFDL